MINQKHESQSIFNKSWRGSAINDSRKRNNTQPTLKSTSSNPERINGDDKDPDNMIERYKLGGRPALEEVCYLSIGPVIKSIFSIIESTY